MAGSKYIKKALNKEYYKRTKTKDWVDTKGEGYSTKTEAQVASLIHFIIAGFRTGFPVVVGRFFPYKAIALYPFVFIRKDVITVQRLNHERIHIKQMLDLWIIGAYIWYPLELWIRILTTFNPSKAYQNHSMEKEAVENQDNANYLLHRKKFAFKKYL